jgi:hypothetical protein
MKEKNSLYPETKEVLLQVMLGIVLFLLGGAVALLTIQLGLL